MADSSVQVRHGSPIFYKLLEEMAVTHDKKSHDYASNENPYGNYHFAGEMACLFNYSPQDAGFASRLAEKLYRISNIERSGKLVKNESIEDTEKDIAVIVCLWMASRRSLRGQKTAQCEYRPPNNEFQLAQREIIINAEKLSNKGLEEMILYLQEVRSLRDRQSNQARQSLPT